MFLKQGVDNAMRVHPIPCFIEILVLWNLFGCDAKFNSKINTYRELSGPIATDTVWNADENYLLVGQVFVEEGATLTIEPGTVIKSIPSDPSGLAPALIIKPGAKIMAEGTKDQPITFTSSTDADKLPRRGLWGGVLILGRAPVNVDQSRRFVEGIAGIVYGGDDPNDNSGILTYVRIWYGGRNIGDNNEINGLTLAGVGRGTKLEHIEVAWNNDDGLEFFGGTVDARYISVLFGADDSIDTDLGYQGRLQYVFSLSGKDVSGRAFEMDNDGKNDVTANAKPRSFPIICNATLIGPGTGIPAPIPTNICENETDQSDFAIRLREGTGGDFRNIISTNSNGKCVRVDKELITKKVEKDKCQSTKIGNDPSIALATQQKPSDDNNRDVLYFSPLNFLSSCGPNGDKDAFHGDLKDKLTKYNNSNPEFVANSLDATNRGKINPLLQSTSPGLNPAQVDPCRDDGWFEKTAFSGAFDNKNNWLSDWSWLAENKYLN